MYWGPTPVDQAIARCEQLLAEERDNIVGSAYLSTFMGGLVAQQGDLERGRTLIRRAWSALDDAGLRDSVLAYCATVLGEVELLAEDVAAATAVLDALCTELAERSAHSQLASRASDFAWALLLQQRLEEAETWIDVAQRYAAEDDTNAQLMLRPVRARLLAERGDIPAAEETAREGVLLADRTDDLNRRAWAYGVLADVLRIADRRDDAVAAFNEAGRLYELKGNVVGLAQVRKQAQGPPKRALRTASRSAT